MELNLSLNALFSTLLLATFGGLVLRTSQHGVVTRWLAWVILWNFTTPNSSGSDAMLETLILIAMFGILETAYLKVTSRTQRNQF